MLKLGWFSTGRGEGSRGFLKLVQGSIASGELDARIEFVFSNREPGEAEGSDLFFEQIESYGLPLVTLSSQRYRREHGGGPMSRHRGPFHDEVIQLTSKLQTDISVLAGYMLITSPEMCRQYPMINLHPALPRGPAGTWQQVIWKLIEEKADESGVMFHVATEVLDGGPVLTYCSFPIRGGDYEPLWQEVEGRAIEEIKAIGEEQPLFKKIRQEGAIREGPLLLATLKALVDGQLNVLDGKVLDSSGAPVDGMCLNEEIEHFLKPS